MPSSDPQLGDVYYYPYIWKRQGEEAEPEKDRPCCLTLRLPIQLKGLDVFMLAISTSGHPNDGDGIEVPKNEISRLKKLDPNTPRWLTVSEFNFTTHKFEHFSDQEYLGTFSNHFMKNEVIPKIRPLLETALERRKAGR